MFIKIVVPLDGSPQAASALPLVRALVGSGAATFVLMRVVDDPTSLPCSSSAEARAAEQYLCEVATELRGESISVETCVLCGSPGHELVQAVRTVGADLIVMMTHGRGELGRLIFGSVAEHILAHCQVPVVVARPGGRRVARVRTLLVPVDGSPGSKLALAAAAGLAREHGAQIKLITAVRPMPGYLHYPAPGLDLGSVVGPTWEAARQEAAAALQRAADRLNGHGIPAAGRAVIGDAREVIVSAAEQTDADLVVMSTHALVGPARGLLGSVAGSVVRDAGRPVLLVRRKRPRR